ncbi:hypothetical protein ABIE67_009080 [Streptomyces sp. V4I8]|uniref:hypothetical protein n=1 Tax=Streptomyces sp. V4I8 TaxID=3156469 RepID=UPI0035164188
MIYHVILDDTTLTALHQAHPFLNGLLVEASRSDDIELHVPAGCLAEAEKTRPGITAFAVEEPWLTIDPLDAEASATVAPLMAKGFSLAVAHAVHAATPDMHGLITMTPERYEAWPAVQARHPDRPHPGT